MGVLAAVLVWEVEHVGSLVFSFLIAAAAVTVAIVVTRRLRRNIDDLTHYYEGLLRTAEEQSRQAEAANRLKDEFLATLSHELRTPLNAVLGWSRMLASGKLSGVQTARAVLAIERAGRTQSRLIEDLLDISRIVAGRLQIDSRPTEMQPLVQAAVDSLRLASEAKKIAVDLELDPALGPIAVDPDRIYQVVWNLVSNAIKFTHNGGLVSVKLGIDAGDLVLSVRDTGIGFGAEVAAHLFERFRQGDSSSTRRYGGLGLGLGIVRHIVELHGGTVTASSAGADAGSLFTVRIPIRLVITEPRTEVPPPAVPPLSLRGISVLVVDDDPHAVEFLRATLEQAEASVVTATSAAEGRERFACQPTDVIISDLLMNDCDGFDFIRDIRQFDERRGRRTPAIALTALARAEDRRRALSAGYEMHMSKPIDPADLVLTVEQVAHADPALKASNG
jgi:signal transduction histidine kinase/ActR/RegA family two-component response regulator